MSLVELISGADERGLAASGLGCLDRCVPLLGGDDEVLRPLWASLGEGGDAVEWGDRLERARAVLVPEPGPGEAAPVADGAAVLALRMLAAAPADLPDKLQGGGPPDARLREWADLCSLSALRVHRLLDPVGDRGEASGDGADPADDRLAASRAGGADGLSPLAAAELRRQIVILELLAGRGAAGLRQVHGATTEGRRILRAVVSRRARGRN
ncbi:hypothetical protein [Streptomyces uncialis]|uniref:Uncharacterized protein n=1 Tax=Streptomyces uncialis TaxID=1048205 RepID=A0A1Q4VE13_9ACTN|nr:hypothetical protein [Streptomyces uncialis]OKH96073.1 hypothetical protein AB852_05270 [Streptomyces uncialis]